ncbi:MAG TPA: hypothetical protein VFY84_09190 [Jiangellales bacterium]|nr:hypothetical protein [Jiangellales bacterium]
MIADLPTRSSGGGGRRRRPAGWWYAALAAALLGGAWAATGWGAPSRGSVPEDGGHVAACQEHLEQLSAAARPLPGPRIVVTRGAAWLRVYVDGGSVYACRHEDSGSVTTFGAPVGSGTGTLRLFGGQDAVLKGGVLLGAVPSGTTRIQTRLATGELVEGSLDGDVFAVWAPGADLWDAEITALADERVLAVAHSPSKLDAAFDPRAFATMCERRGLEIVRGEGASPARRAVPPRRFELGSGDHHIWVYADADAILSCTWTAAGYGVTGYFLDAPVELEPRLSAEGAGSGWLVGQLPKGTRHVDVVLPSGRVVPATLNERFYAAWWSDEPGAPVRIVARTEKSVLTYANGAVTSRPR